MPERVVKRKLIEVALPLEAINRESAREKSIRHGHPSTLHLWWARRPLAAARAVLFAQLVDDPSARPEEFRTEEAQRAERERLHDIIRRLVVWENIRDEGLLKEAHEEIVKSCGGNPPPILDPFAGGGTIPLEAQRLGLEAHASDLNPVAVLINKALIEIPPKFRDQPPIFPGLAESEIRTWTGGQGLAADVRAYGTWIRDEAEKRIGHLYPKATLPDGTHATIIAWIWARTVACPNPACRIEMPLVRSWWLGKKKGKEAYVVPTVVPDPTHPSGQRVEFEIGHDLTKAPTPDTDGTVSGRVGGVCVACHGAAAVDYIRSEGAADRGGQVLIAVVAEGSRRRIYLAPDHAQSAAANVVRPPESVVGEIADNPRWFSPPAYGLTKFSDLFTNRQLAALTTFSDLVMEARERVLQDTLTTGRPEGKRLEQGGAGAAAYADAIATYLAFVQSKMTNLSSNITTWMSDRGAFRETFARQALPMTWDFAEANVLSDLGGGWATFLDKGCKVIEGLPCGRGKATQQDAAAQDFPGLIVSTDPPYYDNIGYSDLSDFFYVWLRRSLRGIYSSLLSTMLVPKAEELVANPYRHDGKDGARQFFESGFRRIFAAARETPIADYPTTVYYAYKAAANGEDGQSSSGWETLLNSMIRSGWMITATWPMRTEGAGRLLAKDTNALGSSIVLALRPRPFDAPSVDRRGFISALHAELPQAIRRLQEGTIAAVDLEQAAIGPGMRVFSRYTNVFEPDGTPMSVSAAYARINEIRDQVLNEFENDFDATTRWALAWYREFGYGVGSFRVANDLANSRMTSVDAMSRQGVLTSRANKVQLIRPSETPEDYDIVKDEQTSVWEALHHLIRILHSNGVAAAGEFLSTAEARKDHAVNADLVKELAYLLFQVAEKHGWAKDALSFNALATSWADIGDASRVSADSTGAPDQGAFDFIDDEGAS